MTRGIAVTIDTAELAAVVAALDRAGGAALGGLLADAAEVGATATSERILAGGPDPDGNPWAPTAWPTGRRILNDQGGLSDSIAGRTTGSAAEWGSGLVYARIHQLGGTVSGRPRLRFETPFGFRAPRAVEIPARPYLGIGDTERQYLEGVVLGWMDRSLTRGAAE